jgi:hypothetical protein
VNTEILKKVESGLGTELRGGVCTQPAEVSFPAPQNVQLIGHDD